MSSARSVKNALTPALAKLLPPETAKQLSSKPRNLYQALSRLPHDGIGARVFQTRWQSKRIQGCFWDVTRVKLKLEGNHGKAWGKLTWRGKPVSENEEVIRGGLKHKWCEGISKGKNLKAVQPIPPRPRISASNKIEPQHQLGATETAQRKLESAPEIVTELLS